MEELEKLEKRWSELASKPKTKEEIEEILLLGKKIELETAKEYKDLINELLAVDIKINSIWDLVNTKDSYTKGIDVLINHLSKPYREKTKEGIIRALAVKGTKNKVSKHLIDEFYKTPIEKANLRWVIGNSVNVTATNDDVESILKIVKDKLNGKSRQMFVLTLGRFKSKEIESTLIELLNDDDVCIQALDLLGKMKVLNAKNKVSELLYHPNKLIKKEAQKTLNKLS